MYFLLLFYCYYCLFICYLHFCTSQVIFVFGFYDVVLYSLLLLLLAKPACYTSCLSNWMKYDDLWNPIKRKLFKCRNLHWNSRQKPSNRNDFGSSACEIVSWSSSSTKELFEIFHSAIICVMNRTTHKKRVKK